MASCRRAAILLAVVWVTGRQARSAVDCVDYASYIRRVGSIATAGAAHDVTASGHHAFACASDLHVIDLAQPTEPRLVTRLPVGTPSVITGDADHVYVGGVPTLQTVNIANPEAPFVEGWLHVEAATVHDVAVAGNRVLLAGGAAGLLVCDVSDQALPKVMAIIPTPDLALGVAIEGSLAYVAANAAGLLVIDLDAGAIVTTIDTPGVATAVAVRAGFAYLVDGDAVQVIDLAQGTITDSTLLWTTGGTVALGDHHAFVCDVTIGVEVFDISVPGQATRVGTVGAANDAHGLALGGSLLLVASADPGSLEVFDASRPESPAPIAALATPGSAENVAVAGGFAFVAAGSAGLQVVDVHDPRQPVLAGGFDAPGWHGVVDVELVDHYALVLNEGTGMDVLDVSDPTAPQWVSYVGSPMCGEYCTTLTLAEDRAFVTFYSEADNCLQGGLQVIDVRDPGHPRESGIVTWYVPLGYSAYVDEVAVAGGHAYVLAPYYGLLVIDIASEPPVLVNRLDLDRAGFGIAVTGSNAYVGGAALRIIDLRAPTAPRLVATLDAALEGSDLAVAGEHAYVCGYPYDDRIRVAHVAVRHDALVPHAPSPPRWIGSTFSPGQARGITLAAGLVYLADGTNGLVIFPAQCQSPPSFQHVH